MSENIYIIIEEFLEKHKDELFTYLISKDFSEIEITEALKTIQDINELSSFSDLEVFIPKIGKKIPLSVVELIIPGTKEKIHIPRVNLSIPDIENPFPPPTFKPMPDSIPDIGTTFPLPEDII